MPRVAMAVAAVLFVVAAASTAILAVPFMNPDNLAYQAWGEQLRGGGLPTVENALTTPHPAPILLMAVLAGIVSPLATWAALAIAGLAGVVAGAVLVAWRRAGATGAGAALLVLGLGRLIWIAGPLRGIDWLAAGAIGVALALPPGRHRLRLVALVAAGLVRPEAWLLPPLLAFATDRRLRPALLWGLAAPVLWCVFDSVLFHDPLLAFHRTDALAGIAAPGPGLGTFIGNAFGPYGLAILVLGAIGARRLLDSDALPGLVLATVPLVLLAEYVACFPLRERYALLLVPAAAGAAASLIRLDSLPLRIVAPVLFAAVGIFLALGKDVPDRRLPLTNERAIAAAIRAKVPDCARIGVTGLGVRSAGL